MRHFLKGFQIDLPKYRAFTISRDLKVDLALFAQISRYVLCIINYQVCPKS